MTDAEEIEFNRVVRALDVAKRNLRELAKPCAIAVMGDIRLSVQGTYLAVRRWAEDLLRQIEEAEGDVL